MGNMLRRIWQGVQRVPGNGFGRQIAATLLCAMAVMAVLSCGRPMVVALPFGGDKITLSVNYIVDCEISNVSELRNAIISYMSVIPQ